MAEQRSACHRAWTPDQVGTGLGVARKLTDGWVDIASGVIDYVRRVSAWLKRRLFSGESKRGAEGSLGMHCLGFKQQKPHVTKDGGVDSMRSERGLEPATPADPGRGI